MEVKEKTLNSKFEIYENWFQRFCSLKEHSIIKLSGNDSIYQHYVDYCLEIDQEPYGLKKFTSLLREEYALSYGSRLITRRRMNGFWVHGIALK
jgi:hypothetical protein